MPPYAVSRSVGDVDAAKARAKTKGDRQVRPARLVYRFGPRRYLVSRYRPFRDGPGSKYNSTYPSYRT